MTSRTVRLARRLLAGGVVLAALIPVLPPSTANAQSEFAASRRTVERVGPCRQGHGHWDLKAKTQARGRIYVEWEVDSIPRGTRWQLFVSHNGKRIAAVNRTARTSRGVEVSRITRNRRGRDRIRASAVNPRSGNTCFGRLRF